MKITKSVLKQLIKEELKHIEEVSDISPEMAAKPEYKLGAMGALVKLNSEKIKRIISNERSTDKIKLELVMKTVEELQTKVEQLLPEIKQ